MEFVPLALACGHLVVSPATFRFATPTEDTLDAWASSPASEVECPEGCGWQAWVAEPTPEPRYEIADVEAIYNEGRIVVSGILGPVEVDDETYAAFFGRDGSIDDEALERLLDLDGDDSP